MKALIFSFLVGGSDSIKGSFLELACALSACDSARRAARPVSFGAMSGRHCMGEGVARETRRLGRLQQTWTKFCVGLCQTNAWRLRE